MYVTHRVGESNHKLGLLDHRVIGQLSVSERQIWAFLTETDKEIQQSFLRLVVGAAGLSTRLLMKSTTGKTLCSWYG
jgi:hypothetical protein